MIIHILGQRPPVVLIKKNNNIKKSPDKDLIPCNIAFALLVHKVNILFFYYFLYLLENCIIVSTNLLEKKYT